MTSKTLEIVTYTPTPAPESTFTSTMPPPTPAPIPQHTPAATGGTRGKTLSRDEKKLLIQTALAHAESLYGRSPVAAFWNMVSAQFSSRANRPYGTDSCKRMITKLEAERRVQREQEETGEEPDEGSLEMHLDDWITFIDTFNERKRVEQDRSQRERDKIEESNWKRDELLRVQSSRKRQRLTSNDSSSSSIQRSVELSQEPSEEPSEELSEEPSEEPLEEPLEEPSELSEVQQKKKPKRQKKLRPADIAQQMVELDNRFLETLERMVDGGESEKFEALEQRVDQLADGIKEVNKKAEEISEIKQLLLAMHRGNFST